jgi:MFS family permease
VGRKRALYLAVCLSLIGSILSFVSQPCDSFEVYMLARFLCGISCSLSTGLQTLYISEVSLKLHRGALNSLTSVVAGVGGVVAVIVALPTVIGKANLWPYLHVIDMIPSVVLLCLLPFAPESPKWLFGHGYLEEARMAISFFHKYAPVDVDYAIVEMRRELVSSDQPVGFVRSYIPPFCIPKMRNFRLSFGESQRFGAVVCSDVLLALRAVGRVFMCSPSMAVIYWLKAASMRYQLEMPT